MATLYETLGVHEDASDDEIKRAYRKAAMRAHPDRNKGREAAAHDAFQEIKEAYAILSDPAQRRVYDAVFAEEMSKLRRSDAQGEAREPRRKQRQESHQPRQEAQTKQEGQADQERQAHKNAERQAQAEQERYERYVSQAMRYGERGHNRDVVFGVLLGSGCEDALAARIADGVAALCASRKAAPIGREADARDADAVRPDASRPDASKREAGPADANQADANQANADASDAVRRTEPSRPRQPARPPKERADAAEKTESAAHAGFFSSLWHGVFGIRP